MLEILYKEGYLDYKSIILDNYKKLDINETEALILIKILDLYLLKPNFKINDLVKKTDIKKEDIQKSLYKLSELGIYITYFKFVDKTEDEFYSFSPLFEKFEEILSNEPKEEISLDEKEKIATLLKDTLKRMLTQKELSLIESWLTLGYTYELVYNIINNYPKGNIINFKAIEAKLTNQ